VAFSSEDNIGNGDGVLLVLLWLWLNSWLLDKLDIKGRGPCAHIMCLWMILWPLGH